MSASEPCFSFPAGTTPTGPSPAAASFAHRARDASIHWPELLAILEQDRPTANALIRFATVVSPESDAPLVTLSHALITLGLKSCVSLVPAFSLWCNNASGPCRKFDYQVFWETSLIRAFAARALARLCLHADPDEFFACGLLFRIGQISLAATHGDSYGTRAAEARDPAILLASERSHFHIDHLQAGLQRSRDWFLPPGLATSLNDLWGQSNSSTPASHAALNCSEILHSADSIARVLVTENSHESLVGQLSSLLHLGLQQAEGQHIVSGISRQWKRWRRLNGASDAPLASGLSAEAIPSEYRRSQSSVPDDDTLTILIIDDDPMTVLSLSRLLHGPTKHILSATDGEQGLSLAMRHHPQIVITDWRMPGMSGIEVCRLLRSNETTRHTYIIMLTGRESDDELLQAFAAGADDYIVKPFKPKVLDARIRSGERLIRSHRTIIRDREVIHHYAEQLAAANRSLQDLAMTDVLTGLPNRRNALARLKEVTAEARRHRGALCCIMIDIDHFKTVNDCWGHDVGDQVLRTLADVFISSARRYDMVSRIGGEEFLVICPHSTITETHRLAERLRQSVAGQRIKNGQQVIRTTISCGVAAWHEGMQDHEEMTKAADRALYRAKQGGRNRVEVEDR